MAKYNLADLVYTIRSKNAKNFHITFDIIFTDREIYEKIKAKNVFTKEMISKLFHINIDSILEIFYFEPAKAVKFSINRPHTSGDLGDADVYGCQQYAPILDMVVDL